MGEKLNDFDERIGGTRAAYSPGVTATEQVTMTTTNYALWVYNGTVWTVVFSGTLEEIKAVANATTGVSWVVVEGKGCPTWDAWVMLRDRTTGARFDMTHEIGRRVSYSRPIRDFMGPDIHTL